MMVIVSQKRVNEARQSLTAHKVPVLSTVVMLVWLYSSHHSVVLSVFTFHICRHRIYFNHILLWENWRMKGLVFTERIHLLNESIWTGNRCVLVVLLTYCKSTASGEPVQLRSLCSKQWHSVVVNVQTMKKLQHMNLPVPMSSAVPWILNKTHVKVAFRMCVSAVSSIDLCDLL